MDAFYLLAWCEDSAEWWQADECEERSLRRAKALLRGRNPRLVRDALTAVVHQSRAGLCPAAEPAAGCSNS